jgi:hypothetical protein
MIFAVSRLLLVDCVRKLLKPGRRRKAYGGGVAPSGHAGYATAVTAALEMES